MNAAADRVDRLRLIRSANIGPVTYVQLLARFGSASAALAALPELAARGGGRAPRIAPLAVVEAEMARVAALGARYLFLGQGLYPPALAATDSAPPALIVRGDLTRLGWPALAIVGARNASAVGRRFARDIAAQLAEQGLLIVSGLARGIDTAAHQGAGAARTAAVIASGIDIVFPPENAELQVEIGAHGVLIAEQPPGREPLARHFPARNRIIAGLALGTLVIEAAPHSGSLITARFAGEAGREVMAVPGSPLDPRAQGCNQLIREGATLIQTAADVVEALAPLVPRVALPRISPPSAPAADPDDGDRRTIAQLLSPTPVTVDELARQTQMPIALVHAVLLELELGGRLARHAGGRVSL